MKGSAMTDSDILLIQRLQARDTEALAQYLENHRRQLLAYIEHQLGTTLRHKVEPEDLLQETAIQALRYLPETDLSGRDPFGWLCQLAEQRIIDAHRKLVESQKRPAEREVPLQAPISSGRGELLDLLVVSMTSPSEAFSRDVRAVRLHEALNQLPEESRNALRLRYVDGLPTKEIAERLGKSDGSIRVLLTRTLARLHQLLDGKPSA
jgi:RNA polymerase sigma-70 factor, ECF subfamily